MTTEKMSVEQALGCLDGIVAVWGYGHHREAINTLRAEVEGMRGTIDAVRVWCDENEYRGKYANATDEDNWRHTCVYEIASILDRAREVPREGE